MNSILMIDGGFLHTEALQHALRQYGFYVELEVSAMLGALTSTSFC